MNDRPTVEELQHLYASLTRDERDQFLQELLVEAARGGEAMLGVVDAWFLDRAVRYMMGDFVVAPDSDPDHPGGGSWIRGVRFKLPERGFISGCC